MTLDVNAYAHSFKLEGIANGDAILGGDELPVRLTTDLPIGDTTLTEVINGQVDLDLIFRHVEMPDLVATNPTGAWPHDAVAQQVVQPGGATVPDVIVVVNSGLSAAPTAGGVEAWAGSLSGTVPVGFRSINDQVRVDYRWLLTDDAGAPLASDEFRVTNGDLSSASLAVAFRPVVTEWTATTTGAELVPPTRTVHLQAQVRVRLEVTGTDSGWVSIPAEPIAIGLRPLPVPSVAAMVRGENFGGDSILLMVPNDSGFGDADALFGVLGPLSTVVDRLSTAGSLASWAVGLNGLVSALRELVNRYPSYGNVGWLKRDGHDDLGKYNFIEVDNWFNTDMEDRASSIIVLSAVHAISFYQHDNRRGKRLTVDARPVQLASGLGAAVMPNLHAAAPASSPPGAVVTDGYPDHSARWGDAISSYRWS